MEWADEKVFQLIKLYESQPCLYDVSCKEYHNWNKKMALELQTTGQFHTFLVALAQMATARGFELRHLIAHVMFLQCCLFVAGTCCRLNVNANRYQQSSLVFR